MQELTKQYYTIGEVADLLEVNLSLLRYWEKEFPFIAPKRNTKGSRFYTAENIKNIQLVYHLLKERKLTIEGAKKLLKENKDGIQHKYEIIQKLQQIKKEIRSIRAEFDTVVNEAKKESLDKN